MKFIKLTILSMALGLSVIGQEIVGQNDTISPKLKEYDTWLERSGFTQVFEYNDMEVYSGYLFVNFKFVHDTSDVAYYAWKILKENFERENEFQLEKYLFYRLVDNLQVEPTRVIMKIKGSNKTTTDCFIKTISYDARDSVITSSEAICKSPMTIDAMMFSLSSIIVNNEREFITDAPSKKEAFESSLKYTYKYFQNKKIENYKKVIIHEKDSKLVFEIIDVRKAIIPERTVLFGIIKVAAAKERLEFEINYKQENNQNIITCKLTASHMPGDRNSGNWDNANQTDKLFSRRYENFLSDYCNDLDNYLDNKF